MSMQSKFLTAAAAVLALSSVSVTHAEQKGSARDRAHVTSTSPNYSHSMQELMRAAQRLRESMQILAQQPQGTARDTALRASREALYETQQAMMQLPPHLRQAQGGAAARSDAEAMQHLQRATERLYSAVHAMANQPAGPRRNAAIREANEALFESEYAMLWLPGEGSGRGGAHGTADARGGGGAVSGTAAGSQRETRAEPAIDAVAGGVGINARARLSDQAAPDHNLKLVFSLTTGNYVADVHVKVNDAAGRTVIDGTANGPWLYAKLPAGTYQVSATYRDHTVTERISVGSGNRVAHLRWPASIERPQSAGAGPILGTGLTEAQR